MFPTLSSIFKGLYRSIKALSTLKTEIEEENPNFEEKTSNIVSAFFYKGCCWSTLLLCHHVATYWKNFLLLERLPFFRVIVILEKFYDSRNLGWLHAAVARRLLTDWPSRNGYPALYLYETGSVNIYYSLLIFYTFCIGKHTLMFRHLWFFTFQSYRIFALIYWICIF